MALSRFYQIQTPEGVCIQMALAGLASRIFAFSVDALLMGLLSTFLVGLFSYAAMSQGRVELAKTGVPLIVFSVFFGYHLVQEWLWQGRTIGKALFKIRVVRLNGQAIGFWESLGRNLLRILDVYAFGLGLFCMLCNANERRFGDFVGGTLVINDAPVAQQTIALPGIPEVAPLSPYASALTLEEQAWLQAFLSRREKLSKPARAALVEEAAQYFSQRLGTTIEGEAALEELLVSPSSN